MGTQILRPTSRGENNRDKPWITKGSWGKREFPPSSTVDFHNRLYDEFIASGLLAAGSPRPSNKYHDQVTMLILHCSWDGERWVRDKLN